MPQEKLCRANVLASALHYLSSMKDTQATTGDRTMNANQSTTLNAIRTLQTRTSKVSIADVQDYTGLPLVDVHSAINALRQAGMVTGMAMEGEVDERTYTATIKEGWNGDYYSTRIAWVKVRE